MTCLHFTFMFFFIREFLAATSTGTDEEEKFEIEKESAWLQFWIWKIIFISHLWWWWWWWWGEMWKWGSEINKFCKNFFVLSLDHRWAAAATGNIVVVVDFSIVHSRWWSFLCFHGKHKRSLEITFFCYLRESEPSRSRSADKTRSFFSLMTSFRSSFPDHHQIYQVSWWSSQKFRMFIEPAWNFNRAWISHLLRGLQWNEIQSWSMRWQIRRRKMSALFSQGMNEKFQFYSNFHYQKSSTSSQLSCNYCCCYWWWWSM